MDVLTIPQQVVCLADAVPQVDSHLLARKASPPKVIALVDALALSRDCLMQSLLPRLGQDVAIEPFASIEDMVSLGAARFDLILFHIHDNTGDNVRAAIETIADMSMPILVITNATMANLDLVLGDRLWAGICGLVSTADTDSKLLSAGIQFALSGGTFFPLEMMVKNSAVATTTQPTRQKKMPGALTKRQSEVFAKLQQGKPNKLIAYELGMSESTTKVHVRSIMKTIGASNRTQAVSLGRQRFGSDVGMQTQL
jgi:DNA-binding NarL/FixJ family response regulator